MASCPFSLGIDWNQVKGVLMEMITSRTDIRKVIDDDKLQDAL